MATIQPDPWKALGLDRTADKSDIRAAYKKLVLKCHPDKVQDPTLKAQKANEFQKVQEAWELLNDDDKLEKYEELVKLAELRRQAAMMAKNMPNSSASRSAPRQYEIRTVDPKHKTTSTPSSGAKMYAHYTSVHSRSHEEMPSRMYPYDDGEKHARRTTSYDKVYREDDRDRREKDEKRRSKREEDDFRIREQRKEKEIRDKEKELMEKVKELEREREARKTDRKRSERDRDSQRRRDVEDKHRRHKSPYIEQYSSDDHPTYSKSEKRSSSKKPYEVRDRDREAPRDKSTASATRRIETPEPEVVVAPEAPPAPLPAHAKFESDFEKASDYIMRSRRPKDIPVSVPTPPPADTEAVEPPRPIPRVAGRRSSHSHEASRSKEKLSSSHKSATAYIIDASPKGIRVPPSLQKSHTSPPLIPESGSPPSRLSRSSTTPREFVVPPPPGPPSFSRTQTWAPGSGSRHETYDHDDSDDDHHRRHRHRSSRRTRSPEAVTRTYKVDSNSLKTTPYTYGDSPTSGRKYMPETYEAPSGSTYPPYIKVKESRSYGPADVKYAETPYTYRADSYSSPVYGGL
ncbi:hypothetical protein QBC39DRAFT_334746 [Podospora conica]|nr:hypothetical protein QBC39DRAFT_334746 [Schizothecium conicum]